jgi:hypothetical protein
METEADAAPNPIRSGEEKVPGNFFDWTGELVAPSVVSLGPAPAGFAWMGAEADTARIPIRSASASNAASCTTASPDPKGFRTRPARCWTTCVSSWPISRCPWGVAGLYWPGEK